VEEKKMSKYILLLIFGCSILTAMSGLYAMLLALIFVTLIKVKDLIALIIILYASYKIYKLRKSNEKS
jgi:hypothetical protein